MDADIRSQDTFYRRGLVLGLTMAEIMILILFTLLLALSSVLTSKERRIAKFAEQIVEQTKEIAALNDRIAFLASGMDRNRFDDLFRELEIARAEAKQVAALRLQLKETEEKAEKGRKLEQVVIAAGRGEENQEKIVADLIAARSANEKFVEAMRSFGDPGVNPVEVISELTERVREAELHNNTLQGQISNLRRTLESVGRGTEMPACWASTETGKPEYIFDIAFTSTGIIVRDNALPNRAEEQKRLPIGSIVFGKEVSLSAFLANAKELYEWSVSHKCRFFVQAYDLTKASEKEIYKVSLRTVGQRFYHREVLDRSF